MTRKRIEISLSADEPARLDALSGKGKVAGAKTSTHRAVGRSGQR